MTDTSLCIVVAVVRKWLSTPLIGIACVASDCIVL